MKQLEKKEALIHTIFNTIDDLSPETVGVIAHLGEICHRGVYNPHYL